MANEGFGAGNMSLLLSLPQPGYKIPRSHAVEVFIVLRGSVFTRSGFPQSCQHPRHHQHHLSERQSLRLLWAISSNTLSFLGLRFIVLQCFRHWCVYVKEGWKGERERMEEESRGRETGRKRKQEEKGRREEGWGGRDIKESRE